MDLVQNDYIGYRPKTIFYSLMTGTSGTALSVVACLIGIFSRYWGRVVACVTSWVRPLPLALTNTC